MAKIAGREATKKRLVAIPKMVRAELKAEMPRWAGAVVNAQRSRVRIEAPPGAHAKGSRKVPAHTAGTAKRAIRWDWSKRGLMIRMTGIVNTKDIENMGLWLERGTRPGVKGTNYKYIGFRSRRKKGYRRDPNGKWITAPEKYVMSYARKVYRTHPGTKPYPFYFDPWRALKPRIREGMIAAWRRGLAKSQRDLAIEKWLSDLSETGS